MPKSGAYPEPVREEHRERFQAVRARLREVQATLRRERCLAFSIELAGDDRRGTHRLAHQLMQWMDPRFIEAKVLGRARGNDRSLPPTTRTWRNTPARGRGMLLVRGISHATLTERVRKELSRRDMEARIRAIRNLEQSWHDADIVQVKLWLTIPLEAHRKRRNMPKDWDPWHKKQKGRSALRDLADGGKVAAAIRKGTDSAHAPWYILDGTDPGERDLRAAEILASALEAGLASARSGLVSRSPVPELKSKALARAGKRFGLGDLGPDVRPKELRRLTERAQKSARRARAEGHTTMVVIEGGDDRLRGQLMRAATEGLDPTIHRAIAIESSGGGGVDRPLLWPFWCEIPGRGGVHLFDPSWYSPVLSGRVLGKVPAHAWRRAYQEILGFESDLDEAGIRVAKVWLDVTPAEARRRVDKGGSNPKIAAEEHRRVAHREAVDAAIREAIARTDTPHAPWHVIPANDPKRATRDLLKVLRKTIEPR